MWFEPLDDHQSSQCEVTYTRPWVGSAIAWWTKPVKKSCPTKESFTGYVAPRADETTAERVNSAAVERMTKGVRVIGKEGDGEIHRI